MYSRAEEIYPVKRDLRRELEKASQDPHNSDSIIQYYQRRQAEGLTKVTLQKHVGMLNRISRMLGMPFLQATKQDIVRLMAQIEDRGLSDWTKYNYKTTLKLFFRWLRGMEREDGYPEEVKWIRRQKKIEARHPVHPQHLLSQSEKAAIIGATQNMRDRAFFEVWFECGRRPEEVLTLHIGDVHFDGIGAKLFVNGKKGSDYSRLISSVCALSSWLDIHPLRSDQSAPVWVSLGRQNRNCQLSYNSMIGLVRRVARRAGIKRRVFPYLFRYTRANETQAILTESQQCAFMGWRPGSKMPGIYLLRIGRNIDEAQAKMNGAKPDKKESAVPQKRSCPRCKETGSPYSRFCNRCGCPLDPETALAADLERQKYEEKLNRLVRDPEKLKKLVSLLEGLDSPDPEG